MSALLRVSSKPAKSISSLSSFQPIKVNVSVLITPSTPLKSISDKSKVYKGGSWRDRVYWLSPGTRRFLDDDLSTANIGFRCAMDRMGAPSSDLRENQRRGTDYSKKKMGSNRR